MEMVCMLLFCLYNWPSIQKRIITSSPSIINQQSLQHSQPASSSCNLSNQLPFTILLLTLLFSLLNFTSKPNNTANMFSKIIISALIASTAVLAAPLIETNTAAAAANVDARQISQFVTVCSNKDMNDCDNINFNYGFCG
jgi:hypothetical protein